jgi:hypothetical protein
MVPDNGCFHPSGTNGTGVRYPRGLPCRGPLSPPGLRRRGDRVCREPPAGRTAGEAGASGESMEADERVLRFKGARMSRSMARMFLD